MTLASLIRKVTTKVPEDFLAPVPKPASTLFTIQDSIPYWFTLDGECEPGWYIFHPVNSKQVEIVRQARPDEFFPYLQQLPRFMVINLFPLDRTTSLCVPFNTSDAAQREWAAGQPRQLHLHRQPAIANSPLEVLVAREMSGILLYEFVSFKPLIPVEVRAAALAGNLLYANSPRNLLPAMAIVQDRLNRGRLEQERLAAENTARSLKDQAGHLLGLSGARLLEWLPTGSNYKVTWEFDGCNYSMVVNSECRVISAGICLAGTDQRQDLASIVGVMEQARRLKRFDLDTAYYL